MAHLNYEFDRKPLNPKRSPDRWNKQLRLSLLFCAVASITAAAIYALVPGKKVEAVKKSEESLVRENSTTDKNDPASDSAVQTVAPAEKSVDATSSDAVLPENDSPVAESIETKVENKNIAADPKGEVVAGDLPSETDKPELLGTKSVEAENKLKQLLAQGDLSGAADIVAAAVPGSVDRAELGKLLTAERRNIFAGKKSSYRGESVVHRVVSGDNLSTLAKRYHTTVQMIRKKNKLKNSNIMIGQKLAMIPGPWRIGISKKSRLLTLFRKNGEKEELFAVFQIGIGRKNSTPVGSFVISHRRFHPVYRDNQGRVFAYGNAGNQLGEAFLALALPKAPDKPFRGYGLHGTGDEGSVGRSLSNGCVRLHNEDILMLYYLVPSGTPVTIEE